MDPKSVSFSFYWCDPDDADTLQRGTRLTTIRVGEKIDITHPNEWIANGSKHDLLTTQREDKIVNGQIDLRYVDGIFHRVIGVDHEAARRNSNNG